MQTLTYDRPHPHGARRGRVDDRRRRAALSRCVQQRAGRRPFASARRRRDCAARAAAQHEHAVSPRRRGRAGRAAARDDSARDRHVPLRQLRERGERACVAHPHRDHGSRRRSGDRARVPRGHHRDRCALAGGVGGSGAACARGPDPRSRRVSRPVQVRRRAGTPSGTPRVSTMRSRHCVGGGSSPARS